MNELNLINEKDIIMQDGIICMDAESIGKALGYTHPRESINKLYQRNQDELDNYSVEVKMTSQVGNTYFKRLFTEEGIYIISMLANTDKAKAFRAELAKFLKQKRLEALNQAKINGFELSNKLNNRYRNLRLTNSEIARLHKLLEAGVSKRDIAKLFRISIDSVRKKQCHSDEQSKEYNNQYCV